MAVVGSLVCMAKFSWAAHGQPTPLPIELPTFSCLEVVGCPLSCPLFPYMEVVGSLICMAKFSWPAHGQPTPLPIELPTFSYLEVMGCLLSCPLSCPLFPDMEVVGSLICMAKFPWAAHGSPLRCPRAAHGQRSGQLPCFFRMGNGHVTKHTARLRRMLCRTLYVVRKRKTCVSFCFFQ